MPKLRSQLKAAAGRSKLPRASPAAAPATPAANIPVAFCPGTFVAETAAEKAAGKKPVAGPAILKTAEASANDAARLIAIKQEMADEMAARHDSTSSIPCSEEGVNLQDPRQMLKTMREGTRN